MEGVEGIFTRCQFMENEDQRQQFYTRIVPFEGYQIVLNNDRYCGLEFDRQLCFTLELFSQAIVITYYSQKFKYLRVYDGQIVQVAKLVLLHFQNLQYRNINHGNLSNENIVIQIEQGQQFVTYARPVKINKIYFTNYELNSEKQKNDEQLMQGIIINLLKLVAFDKLQGQIAQLQNQNVSQLLQKIQQKYTFINKFSFTVSADHKIDMYDIEDSYTSYRYLKCSQYSSELKQLSDDLKTFRNEILKKLDMDTIEFEKNIKKINVGEKKNNKITEVLVEDFEIIEVTQILEANTNQISTYHEKFNQFLMNQFMQNLYEYALVAKMKDIGEYFEKGSYVFGPSFSISKQAISTQFTIQKKTFVDLFSQCQNLRNDFMKIFMAINEEKQKQFKFNINLSLEQSYKFLIDELYYFIISQDKLKSNNILLDTNSNQFKQQWEQKMRNVIQTIYEEYISLELLKLIESLI